MSKQWIWIPKVSGSSLKISFLKNGLLEHVNTHLISEISYNENEDER